MSHVLQPLLEPGASSIIHISSTRALQSEPGCEVRRTGPGYACTLPFPLPIRSPSDPQALALYANGHLTRPISIKPPLPRSHGPGAISPPPLQGYAAAKAGLLGLTHAQAASLAPQRTRVNAVLPGWIDVTGGADPITTEQHQWQWTGGLGPRGTCGCRGRRNGGSQGQRRG